MDYRKFDEWSKAGYKILKGSKATWIDGVPMFSEKQVVRTPPRSYLIYDDPYDTPVWVNDPPKQEEPKVVYYADGSGYVDYGGPCGPLYFDRNGDT